MRLSRRIGLVALVSAIGLAGISLDARAQTIQLATFDAAPTTTPGSGKDFDPQLDTTLSCSGCWTGRNAGSGITYSQSTTNGVTQGTGALQATIVGRGSGGEYSYPINGTPFNLDTHFDYPLVVTYTNNVNANGGVLDPRFTAIDNAVNGVNPIATYNVEFDIVYDVAQMRSIPWQAPEETVDPENNGQYPQRYFWVGMWGNSNGTTQPFTFTGFDQNSINPFDEQWDDNLFPVFHASFPLDAFGFAPNNGTTEYRLGILYNSVFGTLPAPANTTGLNIYFDNFRLVELDATDTCDMDGNSMCDFTDYQLFMSDHLKTDPVYGDLVGNFGAPGINGINDFWDYQEFEEKYDIVNGAGSLARAIAGVPEPGSLALVLIGLVGWLVAPIRRASRRAAPTAAALLVVLLCQQSAQAQLGVPVLLEGWETPGRWVANAGAVTGANPIVTYQSAKGVTQGTQALKITQEVVLSGDGFSWNAAANPNYSGTDSAFTLLANAVNIGAEHFNILIDTHFDPADLPAIGSLSVTLGLNFNGQTIAVYDVEPDPFTTTATIPLSAFNLGDVEDQGVTSYSMQFGVTATGDVDPFSFYVDNLRLVQETAPDLLTLEIDRSNGLGTLKNLTANPISWDYMTIKSPGGALDVDGWNSLDEQGLDGNLWVAAGGSSPTNLVEGNNTGSHTLAPGTELSLGNLLNESLGIGDVDLEIRRVGSPAFRTYDQIVTYINEFPDTGLVGDYNNDGTVNSADYTVWRDNLGAAGSTLGANRDPANGTGVVSTADYNSWKSHFGETGGAGSLGASAVPEPSSLILWLCAGIAAVANRRWQLC